MFDTGLFFKAKQLLFSCKFVVFSIFQRTGFPLSRAGGGGVNTNFGKWFGISADSVLSVVWGGCLYGA